MAGNKREENEKYVVDNFNVENLLNSSADEDFSKSLRKSISHINKVDDNDKNGRSTSTDILKEITNEIITETTEIASDKRKNVINNSDTEDTYNTGYITYKDAVAKRTHNSAMSIVTVCVVVLFMSLVLYVGYFIVFQSDKVVNNSYNKRSTLLEKSIFRGSIYADDGQVLAETITADGKETANRYYPFGAVFAHVVGRFNNGKTGLESKYDYDLLTTNQNELEIMINELQSKKSEGNSIKTTLNVELQKTAYEALGSKKGAVVALDPKTGKILAMASAPSYDPNTIADNWDTYTKDEDESHVLLNRAAQGLYAPGSTFKIVTALEYIRENPDDYIDYSYECVGSTEYDDYTLHCYNENVHGKEDLFESFAVSCNTSFANIGTSLDITKFNKTCNSLLFNSELPFDFEYNKSSFNLKKNAPQKEIAQSVIGQGDVLMTPLHSAMIVSAIANDGVLMKTYVLDELLDDDDSIIMKTKAEKYKTIMTIEEASILTEMMKGVVDEGTAKDLKELSFDVAGKTGTAEYNQGKNSHAWFVCMAPADNPQIVLSIIIEDGGTGTKAAVPVAKKILEKYMSEKD